MVKRKCKICKKEFWTKNSPSRKERGKFCSKKCYWISKQGKPSWNAGTKGRGIMKPNSGSFKKGIIPFYKNKKNPKISKEKCHFWKGGKIIHQGYVYIFKPEHPFAISKGYIFEHRLVMEKELGRYLTSQEVVHHINGNPSDNRLENLMLFANHSNHKKFHKVNK